jgi:hypothetical protein
MQNLGNRARVFIPGKGWSKFMAVNEAATLEAELFKTNSKIIVHLAPKLSVDRFGRDAGHDLLKD